MTELIKRLRGLLSRCICPRFRPADDCPVHGKTQHITTPIQEGSTDATARWIPQQCPGPSPEWLQRAAELRDFGFTDRQAATLSWYGYVLDGVCPVKETTCAE